jgi:hypothetical protein
MRLERRKAAMKKSESLPEAALQDLAMEEAGLIRRRRELVLGRGDAEGFAAAMSATAVRLAGLRRRKAGLIAASLRANELLGAGDPYRN